MSADGHAATELHHPRARIKIAPLPDGRRRITVTATDPALHVQGSPCTTSYPDALIELLLAHKGPGYVCDEIARDEDPLYASVNVDVGVFGFVPPEDFAGRTLLDFGCGSGSSTMILGRRLPDTRIVGIDLEAEHLRVAEARARHYGFGNVSFHVSPSGDRLPDGLGEVDYITLNAVFEHLLPDERRPLMEQLWRRLRPGGVLFIQETPNRLCPIEMHSTGIPLLNYVPDGLAHRITRRYSSRFPADVSWPELLRRGIRGGTVRGILRLLPREAGSPGVVKPILPGIAGQADLWHRCAVLRNGASPKRSAVRLAFKLAHAVTRHDFTPEIILAIRKDAG